MATDLTQADQTGLINCLLDIGQMLLECGAEISRVEDTLYRMADAYGCKHIDVFVITSIISLSITFSDDTVLTETRRIYSSSGTNFTRLEKLNDLSRSCCRRPYPVDALKKEIQQISYLEKPFSASLLGSILTAAGFAFFFGGSVWDGIAAAVFGAGICLLQQKLDDTQISQAGANLLISLLSGLCVGFVCMAVPGIHMDKILIGDIMLLIPGLAMTNSFRNILGGNTISGVIRLTESLIWAAALAGGFMTSFYIIDLLL